MLQFIALDYIISAVMADKEVEDHNAFSRWDCMGAVAMLAIFPGVMGFIFNDHDTKAVIIWGAVAAAAAGGVFLLSLIIKEKHLDKIVNVAAIAFTVFYAYWGYNEFVKDIQKFTADPSLSDKKKDDKAAESSAN